MGQQRLQLQSHKIYWETNIRVIDCIIVEFASKKERSHHVKRPFFIHKIRKKRFCNQLSMLLLKKIFFGNISKKIFAKDATKLKLFCDVFYHGCKLSFDSKVLSHTIFLPLSPDVFCVRIPGTAAVVSTVPSNKAVLTDTLKRCISRHIFALIHVTGTSPVQYTHCTKLPLNDVHRL